MTDQSNGQRCKYIFHRNSCDRTVLGLILYFYPCLHFLCRTEITGWIQSSKTGKPAVLDGSKILSARDLRSMRRDTRKKLAAEEAALNQSSPSAHPSPLPPSDKKGYLFVDIVGRCVSPSGGLSYLIKYLVAGKIEVLIWEPAQDVSPAAITKYEVRATGFQYSAEEKELMKQCAGSLKERTVQERTTTTAGIFAVRFISLVYFRLHFFYRTPASCTSPMSSSS
jgi:hypothetical protein